MRGSNLVNVTDGATVLSTSSFLPGVVPEPPLSTSPVKRRTQSLSALPKDGDKNSPGKVTLTHGALKYPRLHMLYSPVVMSLVLSEREGPHPATNECLHDFQQAPSSFGAPAAPKPRQQDGQQDSRRVVVRSGAQGEAKVPRLGFSGTRVPSQQKIGVLEKRRLP